METVQSRQARTITAMARKNFIIRHRTPIHTAFERADIIAEYYNK
jgi:hypothetical protein